MKKYFLLQSILFILLFSGCQTSIFTLTNEEKAHPRSNPQNIKITTNEKIEGKYTEIGYVYAFGSSVEESIKNLIEQAAEFGGNAVIKLETKVLRNYIYLVFIPIPIDSYFCQGEVIKISGNQ